MTTNLATTPSSDDTARPTSHPRGKLAFVFEQYDPKEAGA